MPHNLTVTIEEPLWKEMKKHSEIRWSKVMKAAAEEKLKALEILERIAGRHKMTEKEVIEFSVALGKKITGRK